MSQKKITNTHTHTFTSKFIPPFLAKTIIPWPLYYLIKTNWIISILKKYYDYKNKNKFPNKKNTLAFNIRKRLKRNATIFHFNFKALKIIYIPWKVLIFWSSLISFFFIIDFFIWALNIENQFPEFIKKTKAFLNSIYLSFEISVWSKLLFVCVMLITFKFSRHTIGFLLKKIFNVFYIFLGPESLALLERYKLMARFSLYNHQRIVAQRAIDQLPPNSKIVILPMDMEYMGAGKTKMTREMLETKEKNIKKGWKNSDYDDTFKYQMREVWEFVQRNREHNVNPEAYLPFVFLDPRRIKEEGKNFFDYEVIDNKMSLKKCFVKTYIEDRNFSGFKIYPALGYYPFDEVLLPIWRYAQENNIPIMAHCIIGTIYYRGNKKKEWNFHPVFKEHYGSKDSEEPMLLSQTKAVDIQSNFTHPMNYLCLLEEKFLRELIGNTKDSSIKSLFGYVDSETPLNYTLENVKICLAHYGGEKEWIKYLETDRDVYARSIITHPEEGINFMFKRKSGEFSYHKINMLWHNTDWYSLITSILMNYNNMYADLSYIISKPSIYPLLNETLRKGKDYNEQIKLYNSEKSNNKKASHLIGRNRLRGHILFGTDFYVVRNHNSDKDLFIEAKSAINKENFDLITRENPFNFLSRN